LADPRYIGTALTIQMCRVFFDYDIDRLVPRAVNVVGWRYAFMILAPGPAVCVVRGEVRSLPEAVKMRKQEMKGS